VFPNRSFYRIKQEDISGRFIYSNIAVVHGSNQEKSITVYPLPAQNTCTIQLPLPFKNDKEVRLQLKNMLGKPVLEKRIPLLNNRIILHDLNRFPSGTYLITLIFPEKVISGKLIIAK
jgi:hypothetical protein